MYILAKESPLLFKHILHIFFWNELIWSSCQILTRHIRFPSKFFFNIIFVCFASISRKTPLSSSGRAWPFGTHGQNTHLMKGQLTISMSFQRRAYLACFQAKKDMYKNPGTGWVLSPAISSIEGCSLHRLTFSFSMMQTLFRLGKIKLINK